MSICQTPGCPASEEHDEYGRRTSVEHGGITQSVLGATGHHLLNRHTRGELDEHMDGWTEADAFRALANVEDERERVRRYDQALLAVASTLRIRSMGADL